MLAGSRRTRATSAGQSENMSKVQMLRCFVNQRLTAAAEEIFGVFERTIAEYEEELSRSKEQNERQRKLLDADFIPQRRSHRAVSTDVQQLLMRREEVPPEQQEWSSSLDQEDPEPPHIKEDPEPPHIKEEQEDPEPPHIKEDQEDPEPPHIKEDQEDPEPPHIKEDQEDPEPPHIKEDQEDPEPPHITHIVPQEEEELWTSQEGEQLQGLEEADIKFPFSPVKSEEDEEEAQSSQLHQRQTEQMETEADGEDCGGPEPDENSDPDTDNETEDTSEPETDDWKQNRDQESGSNSLTNVLNDEEEAQSSQLHQRQTQENGEEEHLKTETEDPLPGRPCDRLLSASSDEKKPLCRIFSMETKRKRPAHNPNIAAAVRRLHDSKANRRRYDTARGMKSPHNEAVTSVLVEALAARPDLHSVHHDVLLSACESYFEFVRKRLTPLAASQRTAGQRTTSQRTTSQRTASQRTASQRTTGQSGQRSRTITHFALHARTLTTEKTRRNAYDAAFKLKAIRLAVEEGNRAASCTLGINESMVRRWKRQHEELTRCKKTTKAFRGRKSRWPELETVLGDWVNTQRADGRGVSTGQIRLKAKTIASEKNIEDFRAGPSWCFRFMKRKGLSIRAVPD